MLGKPKKVQDKTASVNQDRSTGAHLRGAVNSVLSLDRSSFFVDGWLAAPTDVISAIQWVDAGDHRFRAKHRIFQFPRKDVDKALEGKIPPQWKAFGYRVLLDKGEVKKPAAIEFLFQDESIFVQKFPPPKKLATNEKRKLITSVPSTYGLTQKLSEAPEYVMSIMEPAEAELDAEASRKPIRGYVDHWYLSDKGKLILLGWLDDAETDPEEITLLHGTDEVPVDDAVLVRYLREDVAKSGERLGMLLICDRKVDRKNLALHYEKESDRSVPLKLPKEPTKAETLLPNAIHTYNRLNIEDREQGESRKQAEDLLSALIEELNEKKLEEVCVEREVLIGPPPENPEVSIVIPIYRSYELLRYQLSALSEDSYVAAQEIIFVLDSVDDASWFISAMRGLNFLYHLPMRLLIMSKNGGFALACNAGAEAARAPYILFLNSDVFPKSERWLQTMLSTLKESPQVGAVGARLLFQDETIQHVGLTWVETDHPEMTGILINIHPFKGMREALAPEPKVEEVPAVTAACVLCRTEEVRQLGFFDRGYVQGDFEDSDFCLRVRQRGQKILCDNRAVLYHLEGESYPSQLRAHVFFYNAKRHQDKWEKTIREFIGGPDQQFQVSPNTIL